MAPSRSVGIFGAGLLCFVSAAYSASHTLGLSDGIATFQSPAFSFSVVNDSQTAYSIRPGGPSGSFDFLPYDVMSKRDSDGQYHLGDITFRARIVGSSQWVSGDSAQARQEVTSLPVSGNTLSAANLSPTLPSSSLLNVTRRWVLNEGHLRLLFDVSNAQSDAVEIGSLGAPLEFNNVRNFGLSLPGFSQFHFRFSQIGPQQTRTTIVVSSIPT